MAPIRVGLIGLSGAPPDKYEGTSWTPNAHLPYLKASPHYEIVALLNTSVQSAKAAISRYELPSETKPYENPEDLATDDSVDLVVCSVRVDRHFQTVRPSIIAGKAVFVEWPLERNAEIVREMAALAAKHNSPAIVGLQGSFSPQICKMKEIIDSGKIGKVLSSSWQAVFGNGGATERKNVRYFVDREIGGNVMTIGIGHSLEFLTYVLGEFEWYDSLLAIRHHTVDIIDPAARDKVISEGVSNTVPDHVMIHGIVQRSNAVVNFQWHGGKPFPDTPAADWRILGDKGELRLTSSSWSLNVGRPETKIALLDSTTGVVEPISADTDEWNSLPIPAQNIARLYEAYRLKKWYPDFEWALKRHEMIEDMFKRFDASKH